MALEGAGCTRRALLGGVAALGVLAPLRALGQAPASAAVKLRPQPGDRLVHAPLEAAPRPLAADDLAPGAPPVSAWPWAPDAALARDGSRLNLVRVLRLDPSALSAKTAACAADGVVAYAAMCSHAGCEVAGWNGEARRLVCPCHGSEFAALDAAAVAKGPATQPLAMLPLRSEGGVLVVARGFTRAVGGKPV